MTLPTSIKSKVKERFDILSSDRLKWIKKNKYYYEDKEKYHRFLIPENHSILELGCGTGDLLSSLKPSYGVGVDFSSKMIDISQKRYPEIKFITGDIESLESLDRKFDYIILSDVIGHLVDIEKAFLNLHKFCNPNTRIIISYYNFLWEPLLKLAEVFKLKMPQRHQNWLTMADIDNLLMLANFQVVKKQNRLLIPKNIPVLSKIANTYLASLPGLNHLNLCCYLVARSRAYQVAENEYSTTIVVPTKNEQGNIKPCIKRLPKFGKHQEIIFVDGHSSDGTSDEIQSVINSNPDKDIKLFHQDGEGKYDAVKKGFKNATGEILIILDADLTVPPEDLPKFYQALSSGKGEFINGCRLIYPMEKQAMRFLNMLGNKFFGMAFSWLLNQRIKDTLCGTKVVFKKDYERISAGRAYFGDFDPFGDFDLLFGASKLNLEIVEMPIRYTERTYGDTSISRFRHGWLLLRMVAFAAKRIKFI
ncbi:MAG: glycosyltransferase [Desulfobacteraceae bacterium]|nr:glycosyltransferase [Desulfobacteraceae bacterium]